MTGVIPVRRREDPAVRLRGEVDDSYVATAVDGLSSHGVNTITIAIRVTSFEEQAVDDLDVVIVYSGAPSGDGPVIQVCPGANGNKWRFVDVRGGGGSGRWETTDSWPIERECSMVWTYDSSSTANDPVAYIDGRKLTVGSGLAEVNTPFNASRLSGCTTVVMGINSSLSANASNVALAHAAIYKEILNDADALEISRLATPDEVKAPYWYVPDPMAGTALYGGARLERRQAARPWVFGEQTPEPELETLPVPAAAAASPGIIPIRDQLEVPVQGFEFAPANGRNVDLGQVFKYKKTRGPYFLGCWFKVDSHSDQRALISKWGSTLTRQMLLETDTDGTLIVDNNTVVRVRSNVSTSTGLWYSVFVKFSADSSNTWTMCLFGADGSLLDVATGTGYSSVSSDAAPVLLGNRDASGDNFDGELAHCFTFLGVPSIDQAREFAIEPARAIEAWKQDFEPIFYFPLGESSPNHARDFSGRNVPATVNNGPTLGFSLPKRFAAVAESQILPVSGAAATTPGVVPIRHEQDEPAREITGATPPGVTWHPWVGYDFTGPMSFFAWWNTESTTPGPTTDDGFAIIGYDANGTGNGDRTFDIIMGTPGNARPTIEAFFSTTAGLCRPDNDMPTQQWTNVVLTSPLVAPLTCRLWVDGVEETGFTNTGGSGTLAPTRRISLGIHALPNRTLRGGHGGYAMWSCELSAAEAQALGNGANPATIRPDKLVFHPDMATWEDRQSGIAGKLAWQTPPAFTVSPNIEPRPGDAQILPITGEAAPPAGEALLQILDETVNIPEGILTVRGLVELVGETVEVAETLITVLGLVRIHGETVNLNDGQVTVLGLVRLLDDTVEIPEGTITVAGLVREHAETVEIAEATLSVLGRIRAVDETIEISEAINHVSGLVRLLTETTNIEEAMNAVLGLVRVQDDTVQSLEAFLAALGIIRLLSEDVEIQEAMIAMRGIVELLNENVEVSDGQLTVKGIVRVVTESVSIPEAIVTIVRTATLGATIALVGVYAHYRDLKGSFDRLKELIGIWPRS